MNSWIVVGVILSVISLVAWAATPWLLRQRGVYFRRKTMFGPALIFEMSDSDGTPIRVLNVGGAFQSMSYITSDLRYVPVCQYHRNMARQIEQFRKQRASQEPLCILVLGGGGYSLPKYLIAAYENVVVDVIEIDPAITSLAREFFGLDELIEEYQLNESERLGLICDDALSYLEKSTTTYDVIVNDAFSRNSPLAHLYTAEGMKLIASRLKEQALYLAHVMSSCEGRGSEPLKEACGACEGYFSSLSVIAENPDEPTKEGTNVVVAKNLDSNKVGDVAKNDDEVLNRTAQIQH